MRDSVIYFAHSDLLVVPSLWPEPFGLVGPEAGHSGLPAAAFDVGGIADWLKDGVNGYLAPGDPPSSEGLAKAITRCLSDPANYQCLRQGAIESARHFSMRTHVARSARSVRRSHPAVNQIRLQLMTAASSTVKSLARAVLPSWVWTSLRIARIRVGTRGYKRHVVRHTYGGFPLDIYLADPMGEGWYDHDFLEIPELDLLRRYRLQEGARVFDLGAHQCVVALMMSRIVGSKGKVIALEPNSHNVEVARRNRELNDAGNLEIVQAAAAAYSGTLVFNLGLDGNVDDGSGEWGQCEVPCLSVDDLTARYGIPDVLFIDVEGFEVNVLEGATQTLSHRPDCFVEVHVGCGLERYGSSARSVINFLSNNHYRLFVAAQGESSFHSLEPGAPVPDERFFIVALSEGSEEVQSRVERGTSCRS